MAISSANMCDRTISRRMAIPLLASPLLAQQQVPYREYSRCLPDFLRQLAAESVRRRYEAITKLTTPAAIAERQQWVRRTFWQLTGGEPERTPLRLRTVGGFERNAYRVEKLVYE